MTKVTIFTNKKKTIAFIMLILFLFYSCKSNPLDVQLTHPEPSVEFINVDKELLTLSKEEMTSKIHELDMKLGDLFIYELSHNLQQNMNDSSYHLVYDFYHSEYIQEIEKEKQKILEELPKHEKRINKAFHYFAYHFGDSLLPQHLFYMNKLFTQITCSNQAIAVGLESYISPESEIVRSIPGEQFYQWQRNRMDVKYLERDVLLAWIQVQLFNDIDGNLAEHLVQAGKVLYLLNAMFPNESEAYILRYSEEAYLWAYENERAVWNYLVAEQMLFKSDEKTKVNFLNEGPKTVGLADDAPDRVGQYLGYKIVKGYMQKNKTLSLEELIETQYNKILQTYEIK